MPYPIELLLAQVTASGEAIAVFSAVVAGMATAIGVLFKMLMAAQKEHREHITTMSESHEKTIHDLVEKHNNTEQALRNECKDDRREYMIEMRTNWTTLAEIEEKRQEAEKAANQRNVELLGAISRLIEATTNLERKLT